MVCLKIIRRHWICSIFVFSLFSLFSVFGLSQNSYATSVTCSATDLVQSVNSPFSFSDYCSSFSFDGSSPLFIYDFSFSSSTATYFNIYFLSSGSGAPFFSLLKGSPISSFSSSSIVAVSSFYDGSYSLYGFRAAPRDSVFTFSLKITDDITDIYPPCSVCPEIPQNPYDNKLDDIKKAIYCCGAILIMLYFFFCIYKIIVKDGGSR